MSSQLRVRNYSTNKFQIKGLKSKKPVNPNAYHLINLQARYLKQQVTGLSTQELTNANNNS